MVKFSLLFASVFAGEIKYTCEQAKILCEDGQFIEKNRICTSFLDTVDARPVTCLSDESWICNEFPVFRDGFYDKDYCNNTVQTIGAKKKYVKPWSNGIVSYYFQGVFSDSDKTKVREALKELSGMIDCVTIKEVLESSPGFAQKIRIFRGRGCYSYIGQIRTQSSSQGLSLGDNCIQKAVIQHEMMHALGFEHEHNRWDRDNFINIDRNNIAIGKFNSLRIFNLA